MDTEFAFRAPDGRYWTGNLPSVYADYSIRNWVPRFSKKPKTVKREATASRRLAEYQIFGADRDIPKLTTVIIEYTPSEKVLDRPLERFEDHFTRHALQSKYPFNYRLADDFFACLPRLTSEHIYMIDHVHMMSLNSDAIKGSNYDFITANNAVELKILHPKAEFFDISLYLAGVSVPRSGTD